MKQVGNQLSTVTLITAFHENGMEPGSWYWLPQILSTRQRSAINPVNLKYWNHHSSLRGSEGLSHATETYTPIEPTFYTALALASSAIHTSIPLSVQYSCHTAGHFPSGKVATTHAPGGSTQQERSALTIIPCDQTLLQHSGPSIWAPTPTHTWSPHQTIHTKREY